MEAQVALTRIDARTALQALEGFERFNANPRGERAWVESLARDGLCYSLTSEAGQAIYILKVKGDQVWIEAAYGSGDIDWTAIGLPIIERQVTASNARSIAFQTMRRGLVRKAEQRGYRVCGYLVRKDVR